MAKRTTKAARGSASAHLLATSIVPPLPPSPIMDLAKQASHAPGDVKPAAPPTRAQTERALLDDDPHAGYEPNRPLTLFFEGDHNLPPVYRFYQDLPAMLLCEELSLALGFFKAGIVGAQFEVEASSPAVQQFVEEGYERLWRLSLPQIQFGYEWGWSPCQVKYEEHDGLLVFAGLDDFQPRDCLPLKVGHDYVGFRVRGAFAGSQADLWGPGVAPSKGFWYTHLPRAGSLFGMSQCYEAWRPWRRLCGRDGGEMTVDNGMYRYFYAGVLVRYPPGAENSETGEPGPARKNRRELALRMAEGAKTGMSRALSSARDKDGNYLWDEQWPDKSQGIDLTGGLEYLKALTVAIRHGVGVPTELLEAAETGSGYSGRQIPLEAYFMSQQNIATSIVKQTKEQIFDPLVAWDFGKDAWFDIKVKPLLQSRQEANRPAQSPGGGPAASQTDQFGEQQSSDNGKPANGQAATPLLPYHGPRGGEGRINPITKRVQYGLATKPSGLNGRHREEVNGNRPFLLATESVTEINSQQPDIQQQLNPVLSDVAAFLARLNAKAREEIVAVATGQGTTDEKLAKVQSVLDRHRLKFAALLSRARLAAILAGMREVANRVPETALAAPTQPNDADLALSKALAPLSQQDRDAALAGFDEDRRAKIARLIAEPTAGGYTPPPDNGEPWGPAPFGFDEAGEPDDITFPIIDEAVADLRRRTVMTRADFDAADAQARADAFTVAGVESEDTLAKIRDAMAETAEQGPTLRDFKQRVEEAVGKGAFTSDAHAETVFRTNLQNAYSRGQDGVLSHPLVEDHFPYRKIYATHDIRCRPWHRATEHGGIDGTAVYNANDPTWETIKPPSDFNCRCGFSGYTVAQAAAAGVMEAVEWQQTGIPPTHPQFVPLPSDWQQSPQYVRMSTTPEPSPSEAQREAGNYRKGHVTILGLPLTIETAAGQVRSGKSKDGKEWSLTLKDDYGYIKRTESEADGDHIDVFVCSDGYSRADGFPEVVYVINQVKPDGAFDEHKCILGCPNEEAARECYLRNYSPGWTGLGSITPLTIDQFKEWIADGDTSSALDPLVMEA